MIDLQVTKPPQTPHVAGLQTPPRFVPSHTPTRTEENFATRPPTRAEEYLAVTPGCRPLAPDAKARGRCLEATPPVKTAARVRYFELELELVQPHMSQKPVLRGEVGARVHLIRLVASGGVPSDGVHRVGTPCAGPRRVEQARNHAPLRHWQTLRAATTGRHQGNSGGQASGIKVVHWHPCTRRPELNVGPPSPPGRAWG